jgi:hypothetical protein
MMGIEPGEPGDLWAEGVSPFVLVLTEGDITVMAQRVAAVFRTRDAAERAADALADMGADRGHISMMARGEEGKVTTTAPAGLHESGEVVEPAREVGDSGAALTTTDGADTAKGAAIGAVAGLAAGLLALTIPGIGLVLAAGPLAAAIAGGAVLGGVYGGLRDIGIEEKHARGYEERIRGGHVLLTALVPNLSQQQVRDVLVEYDAEDISFAEDTSTAAMAVPAVAADRLATGMADTRARSTAGEIRVPVTEHRVEVDEEGETDVENVDDVAVRRNP